MLNRELLNDSAILLLGVYLREMKIYVQAKTYIQMFIRSISIHNSQRNRKNPNVYPPTNGKTKCGVYIHKGMLFSHQKEWNSDSWHSIDKRSKHNAKWKNPDRKGHILYDSIYIVSRRGKSLETENRLAVVSGWGEEMGDGEDSQEMHTLIHLNSRLDTAVVWMFVLLWDSCFEVLMPVVIVLRPLGSG